MHCSEEVLACQPMTDGTHGDRLRNAEFAWPVDRLKKRAGAFRRRAGNLTPSTLAAIPLHRNRAGPGARYSCSEAFDDSVACLRDRVRFAH